MTNVIVTKSSSSSGKDSKETVGCIGCRDTLDRDHTGIICQQDHHVCPDCAPHFITTIMERGPGGVPAKCLNCSSEIMPLTFERNLTPEQWHLYATTSALVACEPTEKERWVRCPFCPMMIIMEKSVGEVLFHCPECKKRSCLFCHQACTQDTEAVVHVIKCGQHGELKELIVQMINNAENRTCPGCQHRGLKDEHCTHMRCPQCQTRWCYVCQLPEAWWSGGVFSHNAGWASNTLRCPMYLQAIGEHFPHWPRTANGSLSYFHQRAVLIALRDLRAQRPREFDSAVRDFPSSISPWTVAQISATTGVLRDFSASVPGYSYVDVDVEMDEEDEEEEDEVEVEQENANL
jgi:hypothetical protein